MTFENFATEVKEHLEQSYGDGFDVCTKEIEKNNSCIMTGVIIRQQGQNLAPTIYLEHYFEELNSSQLSLDEIVQDIQGIYEQAIERMEDKQPFSIDFEEIKEQIAFRVVSRKRNANMLRTMPYIPFLDLAIIFSIAFHQTDHSVDSVKITNELMKRWDISTKKLMKLAVKNTQRLFPSSIESIEQVIRSMVESNELDSISESMEHQNYTMLVLTNTQKVNGAAVLLYPNVIKTLARNYDADIIVLPSSVHEVLAIPCSSGLEPDRLREMVVSINETNVDPDEVLSDHVYVYRRETGVFDIY